MKAHKIAEKLELLGIDYQTVAEGNDVQDGEITLLNDLYVQVGKNYLCLVFLEKDGKLFFSDLYKHNQVEAFVANVIRKYQAA